MLFAGCSFDYVLCLGGLWIAECACLLTFIFWQPWKSKRGLVRWMSGPLFAILTLLLLSIFAETLFVITYDTTDSFSISKVSQRWYERHVQRNNYGFRDQKDFPPRKRERRRILLLGDSFSFGHGIAKIENRFGDILAKHLRQTEPGWELFNASIPGMGTKSEIDLLDKLTELGFEFDLVLLSYCLNDAQDMSDGTAKAIETMMLDSPPNWLVRESYLLNFLYYRYKQFSRPEISRYFHWISNVYEGNMWHQQQVRFDQLRLRCQKSKAELLVVTFPFLYDLGPEYEFGAAHKSLDDYWKSKGVPQIDLLETFRNHRDEELVVNKFDSHPNERAHALAAEEIWRKLLQPKLRELAAKDDDGPSPSQ